MNLPNDSVIILDSPMEKNEKKVGTARTRRKNLRRVLKKAMIRQLSSVDDEKPRTPLKTVYESVLGHQSNGICLQPSENIKKRLRSSMTPKVPKKRRKCEKSGVNETILILSDDDECKELPEIINTTEIICVPDSILEAPKKCISKVLTGKQKRAIRRKLQKNDTEKEKLKTKNEINKKSNDGDLEIVWSSGNASESTSTSIPDNERKKEQKNEGDGKNEPFFVDTTGDVNLLLLDSLILDEIDAGKNNKINNKINKEKNGEKTENGEINKEKKGEKKKNGEINNKINKEKNEEKKKNGEINNKINEEKNEEKTKNGRKRKKPSRWNEMKLREIVVDGCNVAMMHTPGQGFSEKGLKLVLDYFVERGHSVTIFLPQHKRSRGRKLLEQWYQQRIVVFTPSRKVGQKKITPYDDRFILDYATKCQGIVISSDQYRDLWAEKREWRETIEKRLLPPTFVGDYVMFPEDPLGRRGPKLDEFLRLS